MFTLLMPPRRRATPRQLSMLSGRARAMRCRRWIGFERRWPRAEALGRCLCCSASGCEKPFCLIGQIEAQAVVGEVEPRRLQRLLQVARAAREIAQRLGIVGGDDRGDVVVARDVELDVGSCRARLDQGAVRSGCCRHWPGARFRAPIAQTQARPPRVSPRDRCCWRRVMRWPGWRSWRLQRWLLATHCSRYERPRSRGGVR